MKSGSPPRSLAPIGPLLIVQRLRAALAEFAAYESTILDQVLTGKEMSVEIPEIGVGLSTRLAFRSFERVRKQLPSIGKAND